MPNYTKLFNSIITSTIWTEDDKTRIMWITMLAMADKNGEVHGSIPGMARLAGMSVSDAESSINKLLSPDPYSRTPDNEGRRIAVIDGGWELLNHAKYRLMASKEDTKAATAARVRRCRARNANVTQCNANVTDETDIAEAKADTEAKAEEEIPPISPKGDGEKKRDNRPTTPQAIQIANLYRRRESTPWSSKEIKAFKSSMPIDQSDLDLVCRYESAQMAMGDDGRHRRDLLTFLNNLPGEIDRAREWESKRKPVQKTQITFID